MFNLNNKLALITGSSRGLGLSFARGLGKAGARVILNGRNIETLKTASINLAEEGIQTHISVFDVCDEGAIIAEIGRIEENIGGIDILVNNAGLNSRHKMEEFPLDRWQEVIDINLTGAFLVAREVSKGMIKRKHGKIINICSMMSELGRQTTSAYAAAKGGLKMLTKAMTVEWAKYNIQANGIGPGYFLTEMTTPLKEDPDFDKWITDRTPANRWGEPEELLGTVVYLASDASNFVNGQIIYVDGGLLASL